MNRIWRALTFRFATTLLPLAVTAQAQSEADSIRRALAEFRQRSNPAAVEFAWPHLDSPDASIREAARLAIQTQPFATWRERALEEKSTWASLEALRALAEACPRAQAAELSPHLCEQITTLRLEHMDEEQQLAALQLTRLVFTKLGPVSADERQQMLDLWSHFAAAKSARVKTELARTLIFLESVPTR
jgi:hypothetical protein